MPSTTETLPSGVTLRDFEDFDTAREEIFSSAKDAMKKAFPVSYGGVSLELDNDLDYEDSPHYDRAAQKEALLYDKRLGRRLRGTVVMRDAKTGDEIERKRMTLMRVPYLTDRGTFIRDGNEYVHINQLRLLPGPYTRRKQNGELETQFNVRAGTGNNFRVMFQPEDSQYRLSVLQSELHLYSLLKDLGVSDDELRNRWGDAVFEANSSRYDSRVLDKAYERLVPRWARDPNASLTREEKQAAVKKALESSQVHARVAKRNLPSLYGMPRREKAAEVEAPMTDFSAPPLSKIAALTTDRLQIIAVFLNQAHQANIDINLPSEQLEEAIIQFLISDPEIDEVKFLEAAGKTVAPPPTNELAPSSLSMVRESVSDPGIPKEAGSAGCLLLRIPLNHASDIVEWIQEQSIKPEDLNGIEFEPHVTVAYGFDSSVRDTDIREALSAWGGDKIRLRLGKVSLFKNAQDVVKLDVDSPDLRELYRFLRRYFGDKLKSMHPNYRPHLTLAYVKPGAADALEDHAKFAGDVVVVRTLVFSTDGRKTQTAITLEDF